MNKKYPELSHLGAELRRLRISSGHISLDDFTAHHGLNRVTYWRYENGYNLTLATLFKLAALHNITAAELLTRAQNKADAAAVPFCERPVMIASPCHIFGQSQ